MHGAKLHNLRNVTATMPLSCLVAITDVSGSGKSVLARDVLMANLLDVVGRSVLSSSATRRAHKAAQAEMPEVKMPYKFDVKHDWYGYDSVISRETTDRVLKVDQTSIGKTPRSCPATYIGVWDTIRKLFADTLEAQARGYTASRFSFNTGDGRCPVYEDQGVCTIAMSFLPDARIGCDVRHGQRFNAETLVVIWHGRNIGDALTMEVDEAAEFFGAMNSVAHLLQLMKDAGLGYLTFGQPSSTLSSGETQRVKLVTGLSKVRDDVTRRGQKAPHTLYVLDEPIVSLYMAGVAKLIRVLHRLTDGGHGVVVIKHDSDVIAEAGWILDFGPEGGGGGGTIAAACGSEALARMAVSHTGAALVPVLARGKQVDPSKEGETVQRGVWRSPHRWRPSAQCAASCGASNPFAFLSKPGQKAC